MPDSAGWSKSAMAAEPHTRHECRRADEGQHLEADMHYQSDPAWCTARLKLRRARSDDVNDVLAYSSDPVVTRLTEWPALRHFHQVVDVVREWRRDWESGTEFTSAVTECHADRAIGAVSYSRTGSAATFGYVLHSAYWGRGYATELSVGLVERLFAAPELFLIRQLVTRRTWRRVAYSRSPG
jgi:RimJ/RimL family protein N-acetyltransferase